MFEDMKETYMVVRQSLRPIRLSRWKFFRLLARQMLREIKTLEVFIGAAIFTATIFFISWFFLRRRSKRPNTFLGLPRVGTGRNLRTDFQRTVEEAATQYPNSPYVLTTTGVDFIVFPAKPQIWDEIKRLPARVANLQDFFRTAYHGEFTRLGGESPALMQVIATDLTRHAPKKVHERQEDAERALLQYFGQCDEWTPIQLLPVLFSALALVTSCTLNGRELGHQGRWIKAVQWFPMTIMVGALIVDAIPGQLLKRLLTGVAFLPNLYLQWKMRRMLRPVVEADLRRYDEDGLEEFVDGEKLPITAWLVKRAKTRPSVESIMTDYTLLSLESTPSQASLLFNVLTELALAPNLQELLREEVEGVMYEGRLPQTNLEEMKVMDSVIKECFRFRPFSLYTLYRQLREPVQLSMGPMLPKGSVICVDSHSLYNSVELWDDPKVCKPLRHFELRENQDFNEGRSALVSTSAQNPGFGDGTQACPGRHFAASTMKIVLSMLVMHYDVKLKAGEDRPSRMTLPNGSWAPDFRAVFLFKSRRVD